MNLFIVLICFCRRLFPGLMVSIQGLNPSSGYTVSLKVTSADPNRYKFMNMRWSVVGESEVIQNEARQIYCHPNSPSSGSYWMKKPIAFKTLKITHNPNSQNGHVCSYTNSLHVSDIPGHLYHSSLVFLWNPHFYGILTHMVSLILPIITLQLF